MPKKQTSKLPEAVQLPSGAYRCRVQVSGKRLSFTAETAARAQQMALLAKAGAITEKQKDRKLTLSEAIDNYIDARQNILSPSTVRGYRIAQQNRFQNLMHRPLDSITADMWQRAINDEARAGAAPKTIKNAWGVVSSVLRDSVGSAPAVRLPQRIRNTRPFLDDQQTKVFLRAIHGEPVELAALLALHGLRRSELLALRWSDIDLDAGTISVNGAYVMDEYGCYVTKKATKNVSSRRTVQILIPRLSEVLSGCEQDLGPVVKCSPQTIYNRVTRICADNDLPNVGVHGLRHTFASICFYLGIPEKAIMEMGGWSDPTVLREIYTHISARQKHTYVEQLQNFFK